jgi:hypothetical protein
MKIKKNSAKKIKRIKARLTLTRDGKQDRLNLLFTAMRMALSAERISELEEGR